MSKWCSKSNADVPELSENPDQQPKKGFLHVSSDRKLSSFITPENTPCLERELNTIVKYSLTSSS